MSVLTVLAAVGVVAVLLAGRVFFLEVREAVRYGRKLKARRERIREDIVYAAWRAEHEFRERMLAPPPECSCGGRGVCTVCVIAELRLEAVR